MADYLVVSGFSKDAINGTYTYWKVVDGYEAYRKDVTHVLLYQPKLGRYSELASYYIMENKQISGGIPQWVPVAKSEGSNIESPVWITMKDITSGETTVGITTDVDFSSSSSSSSSG